MVMNDLYACTCPYCSETFPYHREKGLSGESRSDFTFDEKVIGEALQRIYSEDFNPLTEIEENLFNETWKVFNRAADKGFYQSGYNPGEDFIREIKYNNAVFSAFRTHRMQNDIAKQLLTEDGKLKSFSQFAKDVAPITDHHVKAWMRTEYDTAIIRAHQAADWKRFEAEKDIMPNLEWMPTTSITPGEDHRPFWGTIKPVDDPFWKQHRPGDRWNCKCRLQATDKQPTPTVATHKAYQPQSGLDNNPAIDGMLFSFGHPFFTAGYLAYKKLAPIVNRFLMKKKISKSATHWLQNKINELNKYGYSKKESFLVGKIHSKVLKFAIKNGVTLTNDNMYFSDEYIRHALRPSKVKAGKAVTESEIINFPKKINKAKILFDTEKRNFVYIIKEKGRITKFVLQPNYTYKSHGVKRTENVFITAGVIDESNINMTIYKKIK